MSIDTPARIHAESIVIDAVCPLAQDDLQYLDWYRQGGVTALAPTIATVENARWTLDRLARWNRLLNELDFLTPVRVASDVEQARRIGNLGIYFHLQGSDPIEDNLNLVDAFKTLGVGMIQLTYNGRCAAGDGCEERVDRGVTAFGAKLIERLNSTKVIVDVSHAGPRTSIDATRISSAPVVLSHSNVASVFETRRNVSDALLDAIARTGGIVGIAGFPAMIGPGATPTLDDYISHVDAVVRRIGVEHVGLGIDYYTGQAGVASDEIAIEGYRKRISTGVWGPSYPPPPHNYPTGIETPKTLVNLTTRLCDRGYSKTDVQKILGGNWLRVMHSVWG